MSKLEYVKGEELKDELHGSRLFDEEDRGVGAKRGGTTAMMMTTKTVTTGGGCRQQAQLLRGWHDVDAAGKQGDMHGWHCIVYCWFAKLNNYFI
jgi:hypothetical protein